jgi:hypothetical protein
LIGQFCTFQVFRFFLQDFCVFRPGKISCRLYTRIYCNLHGFTPIRLFPYHWITCVLQNVFELLEPISNKSVHPVSLIRSYKNFTRPTLSILGAFTHMFWIFSRRHTWGTVHSCGTFRCNFSWKISWSSTLLSQDEMRMKFLRES